MSKIRLYLDEDAMRRGLANALRMRGVDVLTVHEASLTGQAITCKLLNTKLGTH